MTASLSPFSAQTSRWCMEDPLDRDNVPLDQQGDPWPRDYCSRASSKEGVPETRNGDVKGKAGHR